VLYSSENNQFHAWLLTYVDPEYRKSIDFITEVFNKLFSDIHEVRKAELLKIYLKGVQLEHDFFDHAYKLLKHDDRLVSRNNRSIVTKQYSVYLN